MVLNVGHEQTRLSSLRRSVQCGLHRSPEIASDYAAIRDLTPASSRAIGRRLATRFEPEGEQPAEHCLRALEREWNNSTGVVGAETAGGTKVRGSSGTRKTGFVHELTIATAALR